MTSYFQDGGNDICSLLAAASASTCWQLVHVTSLARCMRYSYWSIVHSYLRC